MIQIMMFGHANVNPRSALAKSWQSCQKIRHIGNKSKSANSGQVAV
jgi:hypothetical protein